MKHTQTQPRGENQNDNGARDWTCRQKIMLFLPRCYGLSFPLSVSWSCSYMMAQHSTAAAPSTSSGHSWLITDGPDLPKLCPDAVLQSLGREYYLKFWVWLGEEHDIFFLLFCSPFKAIWEHPRPFSPRTEPFSWADCNTEIMECCGQGQRWQLSGAQIRAPTALFSCCKSKQGCFCSPRVLQRVSLTKVIIKKILKERGRALCVA